jgi:hypothetical protein
VREERTRPAKFEDGTETDVGVANDALLQ